MSKVYKYSLDTSSKKFECPNCTEKRFVKYVNNETKQYLEDKYGRCDRENECGYHMPPSGNGTIRTNNAQPIPPTIVFPNGKHEPCLNKHESPFHTFCKAIGISQDHIEKWNIGTAGRYTAFGIFDEEGAFLNIKYVPYADSGNRMRGDKDYPFYISTKDLKENEVYSRCFYGLHLYDSSKDTVIVESEKSAVLASYFYPNYNWLATGGNNGVKNDHMKPLLGAKTQIIYLGDNDKAGKDNSVVKWLKKIKEVNNRVRLIDAFPNEKDGYDIADYIISYSHEITGDLLNDLNFTHGSDQQNNSEMRDEEERALEGTEENKKEYITKKGKALLWAHKFIMENWGEDLYMSEINKMIIYKDEEIDDMFLNLIWKRCQTSGINVAKDDVRALLINPDIPSKHPIKDFISSHKLTTKGNIEKIAKSLNTETYPEELTILLFKKWYVGMIANIFNEHIKSPLMLVLFGGQNNGKTWFFRNLLPKELMKFYAENKLDKDVEEIMSGNILVMDDEYGGKSKKDSKLLKDIISKVKFTFRRKFGKLPITLSRIATLCGTTNEPDILVDTTGNRRVIPMEIKKRDFELYDSVCKIQLFLEAYKLYEEGFNYELSSIDIERMGEYTDKFERETTEGGLIDKYFRKVPEYECRDIRYKDANREGFEWLTTTEIQIYIQQESRISRISSVIIGKELRKSKFFQKSHKVKGKVSRYWACKKIGDGSDIETTPF